MNATAKQEEKLSALLKEAEDFPLLKTLHAEKAALETAGGEYQTARVAVTSRSQYFDHAIGRQEQILFESVDPAIDEAITFFRDKLAWLRTPGRISVDRRGAETNIYTEKVKLTVETNVQAIRDAM